jgi:5-methylcytosine-specific restriction endonuclease McrA
MQSERYQRYLRSPEWASTRAAAIRRAGGKCQKCGDASGLEVHHLNYDRLGRERHEDLIVLCGDCHPDADRKRKVDVAYQQSNRALDTYATKKYGEDWEMRVDPDRVAEEFEEWLDKQG